jgi:hypothetical protein
MKFYNRTWLQSECGDCKAENWFYLGNLEDMSLPDAGGLQCRKCNSIEVFEDAYDWDEVIKGQKKPKV